LKKTEFFNQEQYDFDDDKLKLLGWAGKKTATPLAPPGQVRQLEAPKQGDGWAFLGLESPRRRR
jgi:hypothetical protein